MVENQQQIQVRLPDEVTLTLEPGDMVVIIKSLQEYGPYKAVFPIIRKIEQQLLSQEVKGDYKGPPPGDPSTADLQAGHIPV